MYHNWIIVLFLKIKVWTCLFIEIFIKSVFSTLAYPNSNLIVLRKLMRLRCITWHNFLKIQNIFAVTWDNTKCLHIWICEIKNINRWKAPLVSMTWVSGTYIKIKMTLREIRRNPFKLYHLKKRSQLEKLWPIATNKITRE